MELFLSMTIFSTFPPKFIVSSRVVMSFVTDLGVLRLINLFSTKNKLHVYFISTGNAYKKSNASAAEGMFIHYV